MAGRKVKCKLCKTELDKDQAYCIEKKSEKTGKITREYYCDEAEYLKDKEEKGLWRELLLICDEILGYTCISKTKVNMLKEIENSGYTRRQLYNCLEKNKAEIKKYLDEKDIKDEYGKLAYIFGCVKNKIRDDSNEFTISGNVGNEDDDLLNLKYEEDEDIFRRLEKERKNTGNMFTNILDIIEKNTKGDK